MGAAIYVGGWATSPVGGAGAVAVAMQLPDLAD